MTRYWCELAWLGGEEVTPAVVVDVAGDRIDAVTPGVTPPPAGAVRLPGLTVPGLANAHSHAFQRALRGRTHGGSGSFWTWREQMYALAASLDPERVLALTRAAFGEMALAGITLVGEFHYLHHDREGRPYADPNEMGRAVLHAAAEVGVRITLLDACYLHGGIGADPNAAQRRFADGGADAWVARVDALAGGPMARIGAAVHSVRAVDPDAAATVAAWATARSRPLHAHLSEQPAENEACLAAYGRTPAAVLAEAGVVSSRFTAVHGTHLTEVDIALLGEAGAGCCFCPTTERDLADGIGPARRLAAAGVRLALGTDSNAVVDLFEEARAVELDERLATLSRGHHRPVALLRAATTAGYDRLGWPEGGRIIPGALADLTTVDLGGVRLAGTTPAGAIPSLVFAATAADVRHVVVGGRAIVRDGAHVALDVPGELGAALAEVWA